MEITAFEQLYGTEFHITELLAKPQYWAARGNVYNALGKPKISHTLLWFKNCSATICDKYGNELLAEKNQLVYMAKGLEYIVHFKDTGEKDEDTVVIHFQMTDPAGNDIIPFDKPMIAIKKIDSYYAMLIEDLVSEFKKNVICIPEATSMVYKLIAEICKKRRRSTVRKKYSYILPGIELLEEDTTLGISEIAEKCGVCESYFRRMFVSYSGESPMAFRQRHRIEKAKQLLVSEEDFSVGEIAQMLGFSDIYHFSKTFKKYCTLSPYAYKQEQNKKYMP